MRTRVKICGITRCADAVSVATAGADAIGLVFYEKSPRHVSAAKAKEISLSVPPFVARVALFKDADQATVDSVLETVEIDLIQFHGSETAAFCEQFAMPYIKALGLKGVDDVDVFLAERELHYRGARALLLDGHAPGDAGGKGERFDWSAIGKLTKPVILAGGLQPENVAQAVTMTRPYAVDVSSGVESSPGVKDQYLVSEFISNVIRASLA
jgi:phosphoribosylanthranilate isomerase